MFGEPLPLRLRQATAEAHDRLERSLGLLDGPPRRDVFVRALLGFHAFHAAWEPAAASSVGDPAFFEPRRRLALVRRDLAALGVVPRPAPSRPGWLTDVGADDPVAVWGGFYVVEGSALGGKLIARAMAGAPWAPQGGLAYFGGRGARTAAMWAECRTRLAALAPENADLVIDAALNTFGAIEAICADADREAAA